jgi:hypothetical protein
VTLSDQASYRDEDPMIRDLITLPLRIGWGATRTGLHLTEQTLTVALGATRWLVRTTAAAEAARAPDEAPRNGRRQPDTVQVDVLVVEPRMESSEQPASRAQAPTTEALHEAPRAHAQTTEASRAEPMPGAASAHVSEQDEFVESFAEPGAEEGAGAAVHIAEPWKAYRQMSADEVIACLDGASSEELAAVTLYERQHRARRTVLDAAERRLRRASSAAHRRK